MSETTATGSMSVVFPSEGYQVLSTLVHLLGCSVLSFCFARRLEWSSLSKFCTMAIFFDSWLFVFSGGIVVSGIGMSLNDAACLSGVYLCIIFYGSSKMLIYVFLSEKVHLVWGAGIPVRRFQSRIWILCAFVLLGYVVIFVLMMIGRIGYLQPADAEGRRTCIIGLEAMASIPLLTYDVFLNIFLTSLFVYPLLGGTSFCGLDFGNLQGGRKLSNPKLRALAKRTCYAAAVALGTSVVNILILTILHGRQLGWVCLASCGSDVTVNAIAIFLITRKGHGDDQPSKPRALDKESADTPNHVILTRHLGNTDTDIEEVTSTPGHVVGISPKHRKTPSFSKAHAINTKRTRPSTGGHGGKSDIESRGATLSQIGDFAATRDDGDCTASGVVPTESFGSTKGGWGSMIGARGNRTGGGKGQHHDGKNDGDGNAVQMVSVLLPKGSRADTTSTFSLGDLQEEDVQPRTPGSIAKKHAFGDRDD